MARQREINTDDYLNGSVNSEVEFGADVLDYTKPGSAVFSATGSVEVVTERDFMEKAEYERFMQDPIVVVIQKGSGRYDPDQVLVGVNGAQAWLPRGKKIRIPRYFVERLARSQTRDYETKMNPDPAATFGMTVNRFGGPSYPVSVLHDPHPKGRQWLERVTRESA